MLRVLKACSLLALLYLYNYLELLPMLLHLLLLLPMLQLMLLPMPTLMPRAAMWWSRRRLRCRSRVRSRWSGCHRGSQPESGSRPRTRRTPSWRTQRRTRCWGRSRPPHHLRRCCWPLTEWPIIRNRIFYYTYSFCFKYTNCHLCSNFNCVFTGLRSNENVTLTRYVQNLFILCWFVLLLTCPT